MKCKYKCSNPGWSTLCADKQCAYREWTEPEIGVEDKYLFGATFVCNYSGKHSHLIKRSELLADFIEDN
jgi:hypothetical protein